VNNNLGRYMDDLNCYSLVDSGGGGGEIVANSRGYCSTGNTAVFVVVVVETSLSFPTRNKVVVPT